MSFLSVVGKDFKAVFSWLGSSKGKTVIADTEEAAQLAGDAAGAGSLVSSGISLINNWLSEAIKAETIAAAAGSASGTGATKASVALSTMEPQLLTWLQANGYATANATAQAAKINDAAVALLNAVGAAETPAPTA